MEQRTAYFDRQLGTWCVQVLNRETGMDIRLVCQDEHHANRLALRSW